MTDDLTMRLLAEIERREGVAKAATNGPWSSMVGTSHVEPWRPDWRTVYSKRGTQIALMGSEKWDARNADFVAANDPPAVLAYLAALRKIVTLHSPQLRMVGGGSLPYCAACSVGPTCETLHAVAKALGVGL